MAKKKQEEGLTRPNGETALVSVAQQRELAEVQAAVILARQAPRNQEVALERILAACRNKALAEVACYQYARGGTDISGPSIKLARTIARNWGNLDFGIRELDQRDGESTVETFCWDLETNVRERRVFQVSHIRYSKLKGNQVLTDPREIYEVCANAGARRLRACMLAIIPDEVAEAAVAECENTLKKRVKIGPELIEGILRAFERFGVTRAQLEKRIQRPLESITPQLLANLKGIYNSLNDGVGKVGDWFGEQQEPERAELKIDDFKPSSEEYRQHGDERDRLDKISKPNDVISPAQHTRLMAIMTEAGVKLDKLHEMIFELGYTSSKEIRREDYDRIVRDLENIDYHSNIAPF